MRRAYRIGRLASCVVAVCLVATAVLMYPVEADAQSASRSSSRSQSNQADRRDTLRVQIQRYAEIVAALRDSLDGLDRQSSPRQERVEEMEDSIAALSDAIGMLTDQLSQLEVAVEDRQVSLRDGRGGEVTLEIPEDLGQRFSEGISSITRVILDEMPDTLRLGDDQRGFTWSFDGQGLDIVPVVAPKPERVIEGGIVKFKDDVEIFADELVLGDVIVVMGDALVEGRVQGDLVVVLGDVQLGEDAEVEGEIISILGQRDFLAGSEYGALTVVDPGLSFLPEGMREIRGNWLGFWGYQALFLLLLFLVLLMVALTPRRRLEAMKLTLLRRPGESFGVGLLMALVGHMVLLGLGAILVLTVIGIPVALLVLLVVIFLDLGAVGLSAMVVGQRLCARLGLGCGNPWREAFLGMALLHLPAFLAALLGPAGLPLFLIILISWIGRLVKFAAFCFGLGALVLGRLGASSQASDLTVPLDPTPDAHSA